MNEVYTQNPVVVLREEFDDWAILFNPDNAEAIGTNPMGVGIWKMIDGKTSVEQIIEGIRNNFNNIPESVEAEVNEFVEKLVSRGLIGVSKPV